jgi:hypothetical protein
MSYQSFYTYDMTSKIDVFTYILTYFSEVRPQCHPTDSTPLLLSFTAITDHPRERKVPPGCGLQSGTASQDSNQFLVPDPADSWGWGVLSWACSLALSKCTVQFAMHLSGQIRSALLHAEQIPGEVSLDLVNTR